MKGIYNGTSGIFEAVDEQKETSTLLLPKDPAAGVWGPGMAPAHTRALTTDDFEYINTGEDLSSSVGEAFHGLAGYNEWLMQAPQDHDNLVFYNTITGEVKTIDVSSYVRAVSRAGKNFRDKFNGCGFDGRYIWVCPSWTTHALKVDPTDFTIRADYKINTDQNDAYNGLIITNEYVWFVTHSKENLKRITRADGTITTYRMTEPNTGDYHFGHGDRNRSFFGGSDNGDGTIWLHPRRSKHLIKVRESDGTVLLSTEHPLANEVNPNSGYFYGATQIKGRIWFAPWAYKKVVWYDIEQDAWGSIDVSLTTGSENYNFESCTDGRFVYFPPYKSRELVKVDTIDNRVHVIDASAAVTAYVNGITRSSGSPHEGFAGGCLVKDGHVWFSSTFESCYIKLKIREMITPL